ncbi:MAG: ATP-binding protein, partial [Myxococcota bacterium]
ERQGSATQALIRLRWLAVGLFTLATCAAFGWVQSVTESWLPFVGASAVIALTAGSNVLLDAKWPTQWSDEARIWATVILDIALLTVLLALTGGPANPFSVLYVVYIALSATLLRPIWMWASATIAIIGFATLFLWHLPLAPSLGGVHAHHQEYSSHLVGMWIAFVVAAVAIVTFVSRLAKALRREEAQRIKTNQLLGLATLAAGAAHEIGNPLATIRIAVDELRLALQALGADDECTADLDLIVEELARARRVLDRMNVGAGELGATTREPRTVESIIETALDDIGDGRTRLTLSISKSLPSVRWPQHAAGQVILQLVRNALRATEGQVEVTAVREAKAIRLEVSDQGRGMAQSVVDKSTEPFFTTRPEDGMGLGLFIVRALVERLGGKLAIRSAPDRGTRVLVQLPIEVT